MLTVRLDEASVTDMLLFQISEKFFFPRSVYSSMTSSEASASSQRPGGIAGSFRSSCRTSIREFGSKQWTTIGIGQVAA